MTIKSSKYLIFADEAGDTHLDKYPAEFPMFLLAFVIIEKSEYCRNLLPRFADLIARPMAIHLLRPEQQNRAWDVIKDKLCLEGLTVLPK